METIQAITFNYEIYYLFVRLGSIKVIYNVKKRIVLMVRFYSFESCLHHLDFYQRQ